MKKEGAKAFFVCAVCVCILSCASSKKVTQSPSKNTLNDPGRSYTVVKKGIDTLYPELQKVLTNIASVYSQYDTVSLKIYISPTGYVNLIGFNQKIDLPPGTQTGLEQFLDWQLIDSTHQTQKVTKVIVRSYLDANKVVSFCDPFDAEYVEIRSRDNIILIINMNKGSLGKIYARRWAEKPDLQGTIMVRFGINESGDVVFCKIIDAMTTMHDEQLEQAILMQVKSWKFDAIKNPGDVTEVVYPFNFSQQ